MVKPTIAAAVLMLASAACADRVSAHSGTAEEQAACTPDVFSLCSSDIPDEARIVACLNRKIGQLSPQCSKVMGGQPKKNKWHRRL